MDSSRRTNEPSVENLKAQPAGAASHHDHGRAAIYLDCNDWWIGVYRGPHHWYVCLLPCLVIRWNRKGQVASMAGDREDDPFDCSECPDCQMDQEKITIRDPYVNEFGTESPAGYDLNECP